MRKAPRLAAGRKWTPLVHPVDDSGRRRHSSWLSAVEAGTENSSSNRITLHTFHGMPLGSVEGQPLNGCSIVDAVRDHHCELSRPLSSLDADDGVSKRLLT